MRISTDQSLQINPFNHIEVTGLSAMQITLSVIQSYPMGWVEVSEVYQCFYQNESDSIVIIRTSSGSVEKTLLPHQSLWFEANPSESLDVYGLNVSSMLVERIACETLAQY